MCLHYSLPISNNEYSINLLHMHMQTSLMKEKIIIIMKKKIQITKKQNMEKVI